MRIFLASLVVLLSFVNVPAAVASPEGQMTFALQVSLAPVWFDPAETTSTSVPFIVLYAVHDALVKAMPGQPMAPSLSESWSVSRDGLVYEFVLRKGVKFHNGEPVTTEDVKFSFERYRGTAASAFKARVTAVEVVDATGHAEAWRGGRRLHVPWSSGRGGAAHSRADAQGGRGPGDGIAVFRRAMGPEVTVVGSAGAAGRESGDRPTSAQRGGDTRSFACDGEHHSTGLRLRLARAALRVRFL